jgi:Divergent InlB B-repeat domain
VVRGRHPSVARKFLRLAIPLATALAFAGTAGAALSPIAVKTSTADESNPVANGPWFGWSQWSHAHPSDYNAYVRRGSGRTIKVNPAGTRGSTGGIDGVTLVYEQHKPHFAADIRKFNLKTHRRSNLPSKVSSRWDEYHPTISGQWVLFTRYIWTTPPKTRVLLYNMHTRALRTLGSESGKYRYVYSGQVNGDYVAWGRVRPGGQDVFLYRISTKTNTVVPRLVSAQYNPVVASDGTIYYGRSDNGCGEGGSLVRYPLGGPATVLHSFPGGTDAGYGYVDERADGSLHWFFGQVNCRNNRWDIYKVIDSHTLAVSKDGTGTGTVQSSPAGIDCGTDCQSIFHGGTIVTLTATPDSGSSFTGWSDASCGANPTCPITVEADVSLTATFGP